MKSLLKIVLVLGLFCIFAKCADEVGPTPCTGVVSGPMLDDHIFTEGWVSGDKNNSIWTHRFQYFESNAPYTVYDLLVKALPHPDTELIQIWELVPVPGHSGYYHLPSWRSSEEENGRGMPAGESHEFGYIVSSTGFASYLSFELVNYTCTRGFQLYA